jgi:hypothetical protein
VVRLLCAQRHGRDRHRADQQGRERRHRRPAISQQLVQEGADPVGGTPAQFREFVQREYEKWRTVVRDSGATVE